MEDQTKTTNTNSPNNIVKTVRPKPGEVKVTVPVDEPMIHTENKPKKGNPWALAVALLTLIIIGLIVALVYVLFFMPNPDSSSTNTPSDTDIATDINDLVLTEADKTLLTEAKDTAEVQKIMQSLEAIITKELTAANLTPNILGKHYDTIFPRYLLENKETLAPLDQSYSLTIPASSDDKQQTDFLAQDNLTTSVTKALTDAEFTKYADTLGAKEYLNEKTGVLCSVNDPTGSFSVSCAHQSWFNADTTKLENDLAQAYYEKENKNLDYINTNPANIQNSSIEPYQRIEAYLGNTIGLFYRTSPESNWQYFRSTQATLLCSEYDTDDLKKAFAGKKCYDDGTVGEKQIEP